MANMQLVVGTLFTPNMIFCLVPGQSCEGGHANALQQLSLSSCNSRLLTVRAGFLCQHAGHNVEGQPPRKLAHIHFESWRRVCAGYRSDQSVSLHQAPEEGRVNVCQAFHTSEHIQQLRRHSYTVRSYRNCLSSICSQVPVQRWRPYLFPSLEAMGMVNGSSAESSQGRNPKFVGTDSKGGGVTYPLMSAHSLLVQEESFLQNTKHDKASA